MKILLILGIVVVLGVRNTSAQVPDPGQKIVEGLKSWSENNPQEKVFIQTDRNKYLAGESIWFKAWCSILSRPTYLSQIIYVVLSDVNGNVIEKKMYSMDSSSATNGVIDLNKDLKSGNYTISAYTLWMLNFPEFVFKKNIYIYSNDYKTKTESKIENNFQLVFFPEGGEMIEGVNGRIAFKATNQFGFPINVQGSVYTTSGNKIVDFYSQHDGMGIFELQPTANTSYVAKVTYENGKNAEYPLPKALSEGITLQVNNNSPSRLYIMVDCGKVNNQKYNKLFVVAQMNGYPLYKADFNLAEGESAASFVKKDLPPGIMQITIFDSTGLPLAERLVFINNHQLIEPNIERQKFSSSHRGQNIFTFKLDSVNNPNISALVLDYSLAPTFHQEENIASSFLLTSDIKGYINNPGYYFGDKESTTFQHLDLLLLTQGWRRFTWKQIKNEEPVVLKYPVETYLNIRGKVTKSDRSTPVTNGFVTLIIKAEDSTSILSNANLTDKGEFAVDSLVFKKKATISFEGTNNQKSQLPVDVTIYPAYIDTLKKSFYKLTVDLDTLSLLKDKGALSNYLQTGISILDNAQYKTLENVTIKAKKISLIDSLQNEYVSPFFESSDQTLVLPENRNYVNIWQYLNASVPGLNVNPFQPGGVSNVVFSRYEGISLEDSDDRYVKFFLNEIAVSTDVIDGMNPTDIALIKIYKGATAFAFGADAGAISIYTKKGVSAGKAVFDKTFSKMEKTGFTYSREFYHPNYTLYPEINRNNIDKRPVLYWNPTVKKNKSGEYRIEFHNDDEAGSFKVILQGIDTNGRMIYKEELIK